MFNRSYLLRTFIFAFALLTCSFTAAEKSKQESKSMSIVIVAVEINVNEGAINDDVQEVLRVMQTETQKEPGCIRFVFTQDVTDSTILRIYEEWDDIEALREHFKMPHMAPFMKTLNVIKQSMNVKVYEINKEVDLPTN